MTAYSVLVVADEATKHYYEAKKAEEWEGLLSGGAEHTKEQEQVKKANIKKDKQQR